MEEDIDKMIEDFVKQGYLIEHINEAGEKMYSVFSYRAAWRTCPLGAAHL